MARKCLDKRKKFIINLNASISHLSFCFACSSPCRRFSPVFWCRTVTNTLFWFPLQICNVLIQFPFCGFFFLDSICGLCRSATISSELLHQPLIFSLPQSFPLRRPFMTLGDLLCLLISQQAMQRVSVNSNWTAVTYK